MIKHKFIYIIVAAGLLMTTSCEKWLDVEPKSQVKANELFDTEDGFKEALAGVYTILTEKALYGREMTYGMMGVLSHEWTSYSTSYKDDSEHNYLSILTRNRIDAIWSNMYKAIANTNMILENIDSKNVFKADNKAIIKGEALALRAFIHFDLVRLFGVNYTTNSSQRAIPYVELYTSKQTKQYTVNEIIDKVIADLESAKELLKVDPIFTGKTITEANDRGYLLNRQLHLNYYAVEALLARVYLYKGDYTNAQKYAENVLKAQKFGFSTQKNIADKVDLSGAPEQIFALQINTLHQDAVNHLTPNGDGPIFSLSATVAETYFGAEFSNDYRYLYLLENGTGANATQKYTLKYTEPTVPNTITNPEYFRQKMPIIMLSELYFILGECANQNGSDALVHINPVLAARGINTLTNYNDFRTLMTNEFRKEFLATGQLFFYYKRINQERIQNYAENLVTNKSYTFPIPETEYEFADRLPNK
ncbi:RagB/SusD family nutrient uptake outer membrane protein [Sphingobacterium bovistauri]|uniref:RagB/SusD family nutrient uptake outer membrane protein n=1 Tax=Sphingobacterium bovistauri TaxID=2781959 RepID=A0ABS7ZAH1_9SPHI|nr:RagB/SusD family nutrient uptake outer membrane protein [Sphingobacterium bovistauri]MCA5006572.1 RagB/SusD family nutrient uptake outer membrane protein [Sphingobacterium bovistauri]